MTLQTHVHKHWILVIFIHQFAPHIYVIVRNALLLNAPFYLGDLTMKYCQSNAEFYYSLSVQYYERFKKISLEINEFAKAKRYVSIDTNEDQINYSYLLKEYSEYLYISIVFNAFAIEAFINLIGVTVYGNDEFFSGIERKNTFPKVRLIFHKLNEDFDKYTEEKELLELAFEIRNKLVHSKGEEIDLIVMQNDIYEKFSPENLGKFGIDDIYDPLDELNWLSSKIDSSMEAYPKFKALVSQVLGYDIFEKHTENLFKAFELNLQNMIKKTTYKHDGINKDD